MRNVFDGKLFIVHVLHFNNYGQFSKLELLQHNKTDLKFKRWAKFPRKKKLCFYKRKIGAKFINQQ